MSKVAMCTVLASLAVPSAFAQNVENPFIRGRFEAVTERTQPEFDPEPLRAGAFFINSSLGLGAQHNDNIYATDTATTSDTILTLNPRLEANSGWSNHALSFGVDVNHNEYSDQSEESSTQANAFASGRLDVTREFWLTGRVDGGSFTEQRYAPSSAASFAEPISYDRFGTEIGATLRRDRIQLEATAGNTSSDFDNVALVPDPLNPAAPTTASMDFRDVSEKYFRSRASYAVSPDVALFIQGRAAEFDYDLATDPSGRNLDAMRLDAQVGASFELQSPFRGDVAVGYISENKYDPAIANTDGLSVDGNVQWFPTQLTTITLNARRTLYDPGLPGISTAVLSTYGVRADHEFRRNMIVFGDVNVGSSEYQGTIFGAAAPIDRDDSTLAIGGGLGYKVNKRVRLDGAYTFRSQESSGADRDRDFDQNIVSLTLRVFP